MNIDEIPRNIRNFCSGKFNMFDREIFESFGNILKNSNVSIMTTKFAVISNRIWSDQMCCMQQMRMKNILHKNPSEEVPLT